MVILIFLKKIFCINFIFIFIFISVQFVQSSKATLLLKNTQEQELERELELEQEHDLGIKDLLKTDEINHLIKKQQHYKNKSCSFNNILLSDFYQNNKIVQQNRKLLEYINKLINNFSNY